MGKRKSEKLYKGRKPNSWGLLHPRITAAKSHVFASPMDPISMGEGSQEAMKEGG
jgi:hypothetical protein